MINNKNLKYKLNHFFENILLKHRVLKDNYINGIWDKTLIYKFELLSLKLLAHSF